MRLCIEEPGQAPRELELALPCVTLGRDPRNAVVLAADAVSAFHLELRQAPEGLLARDLGSRNGTAVARGGGEVIGLEARAYVALAARDELLLGAQDRPVRVRASAGEAAPRATGIGGGGGGRTVAVSRPVAEVRLEDVGPQVWQVLVALNERLLAATDVEACVAAALATLLEVVPAASHARVALFAAGALGAGEVPEVREVLELVRGAEGAARVEPGSMSRALLDSVLLGRMVREQVGLVWADVGRDAPPSASLAALDVRSVAGAPLRVGDRALGVIQVDTRGVGTRAGASALEARHLDRLLVVAGPLALALRAVEKMRSVRAQRDELKSENTALRAALGTAGEATGLVGEAPAMRRVRELVERVAGSDLPVLVTGETGTGKELVARLVHARSGRAGRPFVATNVATLPGQLVEAELFGAARGAYTGAEADRVGLFEAADGGTLFLDEIGELPRAAQAALLRVLQDGEVRRVGEVRVRRVDVRIVAATNRDLERMTREGTFREDLLYRLNTITVQVPALRERREDVPLLVEHLLARAARRQGRQVPPVTPEALRLLAAHDWPGNVRQLENELARAVALAAAGEAIGAGALSPALRGLAREADVVTAVATERTLRDAVDAFTREYVRAVLAAHEDNRTHAAEALGMSRVGLQKLVKRLGLG